MSAITLNQLEKKQVYQIQEIVGPYAVRLGNLSQCSLRRAEAQKVLCVAVQAA